ncbi:hypothetical protein GCM10010517_35020 [Streptosporangium fragile]|uniref:Uncharacterized protein n=1 Tax=Streptosporangium fragile TaxID=46186 RepID=A0ABP6IE45_9ACTN
MTSPIPGHGIRAVTGSGWPDDTAVSGPRVMTAPRARRPVRAGSGAGAGPPPGRCPHGGPIRAWDAAPVEAMQRTAVAPAGQADVRPAGKRTVRTGQEISPKRTKSLGGVPDKF